MRDMSMEELIGYRENLIRMGRKNPGIVKAQICKVDHELTIRRVLDRVQRMSGGFAWALILAGGIIAGIVCGC